MYFSNVKVTEALRPNCSIKRIFVKTSQILRENTCVGFSFLIKVAGYRLENCNLIKNKLQHWCFPVNFASDFLRTPIWLGICKWVLMKLERLKDRLIQFTKEKKTYPITGIQKQVSKYPLASDESRCGDSR